MNELTEATHYYSLSIVYYLKIFVYSVSMHTVKHPFLIQRDSVTQTAAFVNKFICLTQTCSFLDTFKLK